MKWSEKYDTIGFARNVYFPFLKVIKHWLWLGCLVLFARTVSAQTYPVQTFVQVSPPHTSYLPDYTDPLSNQLKIFLTLTDFTVPSYQVKLRFKLEGNGYTITTASLLNLPVTTLSPGVPVELSGSDLAPYLASQNLLFSGVDVADYELRKVLPEGPCQLCVEVIDFANPNQAVLSNPACTPVWFSLNDPPLLNTPFCGNQIAPTDPQGILFSWTPLHMNSLHSAGTNYVFELFEIRPNGADPNQVVNASLPIFMQVTDQTFLNYGITEPQLQVGMSYVWRVRAQDIQGRDFFRNDGYSSVCTFTYGNIASSLAEGIQLNLNSNGTGTRMGLAWWNTSETFTHYKVEVRKTGNPDYEWFPFEAEGGELKIYQLEPATQYECRVKGLIGTEYESAWSNTSVFTTQQTPDYACGSTTLPPKQQQLNPLLNAISGMTFGVGQFELFVTEIEPLNAVLMPGHYRGTGKIAVGFTMVNLRVRFDDIYVDDNLTVRSGKVEAISEGIDAWLNAQSQTDPDYYVDGTITDFEWNDTTSLTVWVDGQPQEFQFPENGILIIQDEEGMIYTFHEDGTWSVISVLTYSSDVLAATKDYRVDFFADPAQQFGFDQKKYAAWVNDYEVIQLADSTNYWVPYKSLAAANQSGGAGSVTDVVLAQAKSPATLSDLSFVAVRNGESTPLVAQNLDDSTWQVTLTGLDESCYVYALHNGDRIGKLWVKVLSPIEKEVVIVPVGNAALAQTDAAALQNQLNTIYAQACVSFAVSFADNYVSSTWDLNADGKLQHGDVNLMSHYSEEMRLLRDQYFEAHPDYNKEAYYLFVVPDFLTGDLAGYMVRGKSVGFLRNGVDAQTAAHELAHGVFSLEHTFPEIAAATTNNLLDYNNGSHLTQKQWHAIHEPLPALSMFDDEEEGELVFMAQGSGSRLVYRWINESPLSSYDFNSIYTPSGKVIRLTDPTQMDKISFDVLTGGVSSFEYDGVQYRSIYSVPTNSNPSQFVGYVRYDYWGALQQEYDKFQELGADTLSNFVLSNKLSEHAGFLSERHEVYFTAFSSASSNDLTLAMYTNTSSGCARSIVKYPNQTNQTLEPFFDEYGRFSYSGMGALLSLTETDFLLESATVLDDEFSDNLLSQDQRDLLCQLVEIYDKANGLARWHIDHIIAINQLSSVYDLGIKSTTFLANVVTISKAYEEFGTDLMGRYGVEIDNIGCLDVLGSAFLNSFGFDLELIAQPQNGEQYAEILVQKINNFRSRFSTITNSSDASETLAILRYFENEELALLSVDTRIKCLKLIADQFIHLDSEEGLAVRLVQTCPLEHANAFLTKLDQPLPIEGELLAETSLLYELIDDIYGDEAGPFSIALFELWTNSVYYDFDHPSYDYSTPACYYSPDGKRYLIDYESQEGFAGFFDSNYEVDRSNRAVWIEEEGVGNCRQEFSAYQPIGLTRVDQVGTISMPGYGIPAFYLYAFEHTSGEANAVLASKIAFDVILTFSGVGNLTKLRYLSALNKLSLGQKASIVIGGVEFTSGMASIVLQYTCDDESQWCNEIKNVLFMIEVASLGSDVLLKQLIKIRCQRIINDNLMPANAPEELREIVTRYADDLELFGKYSTKIDHAVIVLPKESLFGNDALTFLDAEYRTVKATQDVTAYRVFGGNAKVGGTFVTTESGVTRAELALLDEWNNSMRFEATINIPIGTKMNIGKVGSQKSTSGAQSLPGGADQVILPYQWNTDWVTRIVDSSTGKVYNSVSEFAIDFPDLAN